MIIIDSDTILWNNFLEYFSSTRMTSNSTNVPGFKTVTEEHSNSYLRNYGAHAIGISPDDVTDYYNKWTTYDQVW